MPNAILSERAVYARVFRKLVKDNMYLRRCRRSSKGFHYLGRYYITDWRNCIFDMHVSLLGKAQEIGVIGPKDEIADE